MPFTLKPIKVPSARYDDGYADPDRLPRFRAPAVQSGKAACAFTAITAKIKGRTKTGKEKWFEIGYTRYSVVFTGETLPNGTEADAVYIMLNPPYRDLLNHVD